MSSTKKKNFKTDPIFDIDPVSGKLIPLPMNWNNIAPGNSSSKKRTEKRPKRTVELKPLHLMFGDSKEPEPKLIKTETNSVRKGLFTVPSGRSSQRGKGSLNKKNSAVRKNLNKRQTQTNKNINTVELSPLMNLEEVEEEFLNKKASLRGYPFKSPSKPVLNFTTNTLKFDTKPKKFIIPQMIVEEPTQSSSQIELEAIGDEKLEEPKTPDSASSEFLKLEQMCQDKEMRNICTDSPISSMCNLLSDTGLDSTKKPKPKKNSHKYSNVVTNIKNIIQSEEIAFNQYRIVHEGNMKKLYHILSSFEEPEIIPEPETPGRENHPNKINRRSIRLQNKSPQGTNDKLLVSPSILRSGDLRKSTLKKNLAARNQDLNNQSPRTRKAFDLYNTFREKHSILETPRLDRKALAESPSMGRYISMKVQNQCLLLQDTPVHK